MGSDLPQQPLQHGGGVLWQDACIQSHCFS
uniref:Uncharacterized protein n=1 Tax=Arundo donax TaxID=35708 RepID=A0A0A9BZW7_ARUDO